ncbi:hypothetical protein [Actinocorallia sp. A-T 12471]|uniref:hypothetical protein n=1 Tax=Actinocorallia sp. A-T 12471 TaxID=3089813 RepID=UPI0029CEEA6D|nr:hypothetical protein [Actinocorallia sp. A-T 12471]MDX6739470.1 hypothetical protein [Actinocorallia sp. A-T 12471]
MRRGLVVTGVGIVAVLAGGAGVRWFDGVPLVRACEVLTGDFAAQVLGGPVLSNDDMGPRSTECQYMSTPAGGSVTLEARRYKATARESAPERARRLGLRHRGKPYPGLGEEAYLSIYQIPHSPTTVPSPQTAMGQLVIVVDNVIIRVGAGGLPTPQIRTTTEKLARAYLSRLTP